MTNLHRRPEDVLEDDEMTRDEKIDMLEKMAYELSEREVAELEGMTKKESAGEPLELTPRQALNRLRDGDRTPTNTQHGSV